MIGGLVMWPLLDYELQLSKGFQIETFRRVKCIIDCTEIFIERPLALKGHIHIPITRKETRLHLVGISQSGAVTFLSDCWGGIASDRKITLRSGICYERRIYPNKCETDSATVHKREKATFSRKGWNRPHSCRKSYWPTERLSK